MKGWWHSKWGISVGVIKGKTPKTLKQQFRLTAKEQGRQKKYVAREKQATG